MSILSAPMGHPCSASHACPTRYAHILELLQVQPGQRVLNIGSGTGYLRSPFIQQLRTLNL